MTKQGDIRIGVSGWTYRPWRGNFYPDKLVQKRELSYAAGQFNALEINGTFYSLQSPDSFRQWAAATPDDFVFAVKGPRFITHMLKLDRVEQPLANFFANGVLTLGPKLGPILWQFPPSFRFSPEKLESFFKLLPRDNLKLRFFVPQPRLGTLAVGQRVTAQCDGCAADIAATVSFIASEAEFTPPVIYSNDTRSKLVFMVEARPMDPSKPHMIIDQSGYARGYGEPNPFEQPPEPPQPPEGGEAPPAPKGEGEGE